MGRTIRARFSKGVIKPLEKIDMSEGKEVSVTIIDLPSVSEEDAFERAAGSWKGTIDVRRLIKNIYNDRLLSTRKEPKL